MITLGVSVYPDLRPIEEIAEYLRMVSKHGFTRVFSSAFSVEGTPEEVFNYFKQLDDIAHECGMKVSLDVNPEFLEKMGVTPDDIHVMHDMGCDIIRMDGSYGDTGDIQIINNPYDIMIEFNASLPIEMIQNLVNKGANKERMLTCHNFYPQRLTGVKWQKFLNTNKVITEYGMRIGAFIATHNNPTHGVWDSVDGLPTVEMIRDMPVDLQARLLIAGGATDVFFGNAYASEEEVIAVEEIVKGLGKPDPAQLDEFKGYIPDEILENIEVRKLKVKFAPDATDVEKEIVLTYFPHVDMGDASEWIWRNRGPRVKYKNYDFPPRKVDKEYFEVGDVVTVNDNYRHYHGEIQICRIPFKNDGQRNLVGHINESEMKMFDCIKDGDLLIFVEDK